MIRVLRTFTLTLLLAGVAASVATADTFPGPGSYTHGIYTSNGDVYSYGVYVPSSYRSGQHVPLLVMIHGCNTPADVQALTVEYDSLAEQHDFIVLYPEGDAADLAAFHCWKAFWAPKLEGRAKGDAAAIAGMTRTVMSAGTIDPARIYAIGMSSGAFETSVLGAEYPDLYAAIGIHSGAAFMHGENGCFVTYAPTFSTDSLASDAYAAEGPRARLVPVILFHGDNDHIVPYQCGQQALAQWLKTDNDVLSAANAPTIPTAPAATMNGQSGGYAYTDDSYHEPDGCTIAQFWTIHGMDHTWWPSASAASWAFFSAHRLTPPGAASPCVNTSPSTSAPIKADCPRATGRLRGQTLGLVRLGMTRKQAHHEYAHSSDRAKHFEDFFCLTPIGVRVGYASPSLLKTLPTAEQKHLRGRVVWASTSNAFYAVGGVRPGATVASAAKRLKLTGPLPIGLNYWYLAPNGTSTAVLKVRHGVVEEIGVADKHLTRGHKAELALLKSFS